MYLTNAQRRAVIITAVLMLNAAGAYLITIYNMVLSIYQPTLSLGELCWILSPAVLLVIYATALLLCYKHQEWRPKTSYMGNKYKWMG